MGNITDFNILREESQYLLFFSNILKHDLLHYRVPSLRVVTRPYFVVENIKAYIYKGTKRKEIM